MVRYRYDDWMTAAEKLKAWRVETVDISQADAAERAGISQAAWSDYEAGKKKPQIEQAIRLSELTEDSKHHVAVRDWRESDADRAARAQKRESRSAEIRQRRAKRVEKADESGIDLTATVDRPSRTG